MLRLTGGESIATSTTPGNPYQYRYPSAHGVKYDIWSYGPDGMDGTQDDICNWPQ